MSVHSSANTYTPDEMMTIAAARLIWPGCVCFVGIGVPSAAANLARLTHAPEIVRPKRCSTTWVTAEKS